MLFLENKPTKSSVSVLGIPIDIGKDNVGTDEGPDHLRKGGLKEMFNHIGIKFQDLGNVPCPTRELSQMGDKNVKYLKEIVQVAKETAAIVKTEVEKGNKVVALGGDHSLSLGTISGASAACSQDIGVIYIDAHGDMMTHENTISGNVHGMPTSALMGFGHPELTNILNSKVKVKPENFVFIGLKDLDQGEIDLIRKEKINAVTIMDIMQSGLGLAFEKIKALQSRVKNIWVSLDLDSIDSEFAPATPIINLGGLSYREIVNLSKYIGKVCNVVGMDVVELFPRQDREEKTTKLAISLVAHLLGAEYSWYTQYMDHEAKKQEARSHMISIDEQIKS